MAKNDCSNSSVIAIPVLIVLVLGVVVVAFLTAIRFAIAFLAPAIIYLPVRKAMGASIIPPFKSSAYSLHSPKSPADVVFTCLFLSMFTGGGFGLLVGVICGGLITGYSFLSWLFGLAPLSHETISYMLPLMLAAYCFGIGRAAIEDVRKEREAESVGLS